MSADDGIRIEHVSFYSEACRLDGELYLPADLKPDSKVPGMVLITGYMGTRDMYLPGMAAEITKSGRYVSLIFDFKGWGTSQPAPYPHRLAPYSRVMDAQAAINFLSLHPSVDPRKLCLWGISFGGLTSVFLQAIDRNVKCIAVVASGVAPPTGSAEAKAEQAALTEAEKKQRAAQAADLRKVIEEEKKRAVLTGKVELIARDRIMRMDERSKARSEKQRNSLSSGPAVTHVPASFLPETATFPASMLTTVASLAHHAVFVTSESDKVLPPSHAKQLYDKCGGPKKFAVIPKEKDLDHFALYEAENVKEIVRDLVLPAFNEWFAEEDAKKSAGSKSKM